MIVRLGNRVRAAASKFGNAGIALPRLDAEVIMAYVLGCERLQLPLRHDEVLSEEQCHAFEALVAHRLARMPVAHILGMREFWSLPFKVSRSVLTPRPDSETLIAALVGQLSPVDAPWHILDLGTGSGCLIAALLSELPNAQGVGIDISPSAVGIARENLKNLGLGDRAQILEGDLFLALQKDRVFDVIISNPPYIESAEIAALEPEVRLYEPLLALDGGMDGLRFYRRIAVDVGPFLNPGGMLALEIGSTQGAAVCGLLQTGWTDIRVIADLEGRDRAVLAKRAE